MDVDVAHAREYQAALGKHMLRLAEPAADSGDGAALNEYLAVANAVHVRQEAFNDD